MSYVLELNGRSLQASTIHCGDCAISQEPIAIDQIFDILTVDFSPAYRRLVALVDPISNPIFAELREHHDTFRRDWRSKQHNLFIINQPTDWTLRGAGNIVVTSSTLHTVLIPTSTELEEILKGLYEKQLRF